LSTGFLYFIPVPLFNISVDGYFSISFFLNHHKYCECSQFYVCVQFMYFVFLAIEILMFSVQMIYKVREQHITWLAFKSNYGTNILLKYVQCNWCQHFT